MLQPQRVHAHQQRGAGLRVGARLVHGRGGICAHLAHVHEEERHHLRAARAAGQHLHRVPAGLAEGRGGAEALAAGGHRRALHRAVGAGDEELGAAQLVGGEGEAQRLLVHRAAVRAGEGPQLHSPAREQHDDRAALVTPGQAHAHVRGGLGGEILPAELLEEQPVAGPERHHHRAGVPARLARHLGRHPQQAGGLFYAVAQRVGGKRVRGAGERGVEGGRRAPHRLEAVDQRLLQGRRIHGDRGQRGEQERRHLRAPRRPRRAS